MMQDTTNRLEAEFATYPIMCATEVPTESEVDQAEREIDVPFPSDYREFLLRYGGAMVEAHPIFGLRPVEVMGVDSWSVVTLTKRYRSQGVPGTDRWIIVSSDHGGNPIGVDLNGAVWIHDHDFGGVTLLAESFEDFIRRICLRLPK